MEATETECRHGLAPSWCSFCLGTVKTKGPKGPLTLAELRSPLRPVNLDGPRPDPAERIAGLVAAGVLCPRCYTDTGGRGCACSRKAAYAVGQAQAARWLHSDQAAAGFTPKEVAGLALSTQARAARLASALPDEAAEERACLMLDFAVEPRWTQYRRTEQNHLPI